MPRKKKSKKAVLSDDDISCLIFLWKWRISTTAALSKKFYPHKNSRRGYERLRVLEQACLIESRADARAKKFIWRLTKKGFLTVRPHLPLLKEEGFRPAAPGHDLLSAAAMLGDWLTAPQKGVRLISEQQLSRYEESPIAIVQPYGTSHKADGYWFYPAKGYLIALEVQLTSQRQAVYDHVGAFYRQKENDHIRHVLWVLTRLSMKDTIMRYLESAGVDLSRHQFISFKAFFEKGWSAEIEAGSLAEVSLSKFLHGYLGEDTTSKSTGNEKLLLDVRKSPHMAKNEVYYEPLDTWM